MRNILLFFLTILLSGTLRADGVFLPMSGRTVIKIKKRLVPGTTIDSVYMTVYYLNQTDTVTTNNKDDWKRMWLREREIELTHRLTPEKYQFHFFISGRWIHSPVLFRNGSLDYHVLSISNNKVSDISPLIGVPWSVYFIYLLFTIVTEVALGRMIFRSKRKKMQRVIIGMNLVSHPLLWIIAIIAGHYAWALSPVILFFGEIAVFIAEALVLQKAMKLIEKKETVGFFFPFLISFALNLTSFVIGWTAYGIIGEFII